MEKFYSADLEESFARFERAAAKGHEESIWIGSVVQDVEIKESALIEAFAKMETPLGWHVAGRLSDGRQEFDFYKKSAEGGCSWGQVWYGRFFRGGAFVERDTKVYVEWFEKAVNQNNPLAMNWLGIWFRHGVGNDMEEAVSYYRAASELGWKDSMDWLAYMLWKGEGCEQDLRQAAIWGAKGKSRWFWEVVMSARVSLDEGTMEQITCDFDQLCYTLGWGVYWYLYENYGRWVPSDEAKAFGNRCLDYYCSCAEMQQTSISTFLLYWNRTTGVKGPGQMIAQIVWEEREDNLVKTLEKPSRRSARLKRIKK
jgi:hypothetical protein